MELVAYFTNSKTNKMTDEQFIAHMKANPHLHSKKAGRGMKGSRWKSNGCVNICNRFYEVQTCIPYTYNTKTEKINEAFKSIENLTGYHVEIRYTFNV